MPYRILGRTGVKVYPLCLGTMNLGGRTDADEAGRVLDTYFDAGGNFIDTANVYNDGHSESIIGNWLAQRGVRDQVVLSTKVHGRRSPHINDAGNHRWHIVREVEKSLARLKTDRIDLYHIHRPDPDTPIDQTLRALDDLVRQGKVLYLASSTFPAWATGTRLPRRMPFRSQTAARSEVMSGRLSSQSSAVVSVVTPILAIASPIATTCHPARKASPTRRPGRARP